MLVIKNYEMENIFKKGDEAMTAKLELHHDVICSTTGSGTRFKLTESLIGLTKGSRINRANFPVF